MVAIVLTKDATTPMKAAFYFFGTTGETAVHNQKINEMVEKARRDIGAALTAKENVTIEVHRMILISSIQHYLSWTSDKTRVKNRAIRLRNAMIAELPAAVDAIYSPDYVLLV